MAFKQHTLRTIRNLLYRHARTAKEKFNQANRALLRSVTSDSDPIEEAPQITNRRMDERWRQLQPVWVLSTGRTGTNTLTELLKLSPELDAFHEPAPELFQFSYDYYMDRTGRDTALQTLGYLRDELVFRSVRDGFTFVETNNRVTYLADLLLELYPASKFIHIYRNPYDFIRSGMRRAYYRGHMRDYARIQPKESDPSYDDWENFSNLQKVAWNWKAVNSHCLRFMQKLPDAQKMSFSSEALFKAEPSLVTSLFYFTGTTDYQPPMKEVRRVMGKKHNAQKKGRFSKPAGWTDQQATQADEIIAPVARELDITLLSTESHPSD